MAKQRAGKPARKPAQPFQMPPFQRSLPMLLLWAREAVMQRFRPPMHAQGLTEQQWRIIRALAEVESLEIRALSKRCCIHAASLSRILPKLGRDGLVARCSHAGDQRRVLVRLTPHGRRLFETIVPILGRIYAEIARDIPSGWSGFIVFSMRSSWRWPKRSRSEAWTRHVRISAPRARSAAARETESAIIGARCQVHSRPRGRLSHGTVNFSRLACGDQPDGVGLGQISFCRLQRDYLHDDIEHL